MKKYLFLLSCMTLPAFLSGCATELSKTEYAVNVVSNNPGKGFRIYNSRGEFVHQGMTPQIVVLKAGGPDFFEKEKYVFEFDGKKRPFISTVTPLYWFNFIGFVGFAVDGMTGAMWALPSRVNIDRPQYDDPSPNW